MMSRSKFYKERKQHIQRTAHYFEAGTEEGKYAWMMTHGYAMTGEQLIQKFDKLDMKRHHLISAEALSYFYFEQGGNQIPVASWMTRRYRLDEISDYSHYLNSLFVRLNNNSVRILLGFSQGGTTMWRFINEMKPDFRFFINWAGDIPEDTEYDLDYLDGKTLIYIYGDKDQYVTPDRVGTLRERVDKLGLNIEFLEYSGIHRIEREVLYDWIDKNLK